MSFLNQLKSQANALQADRGREQTDLSERLTHTEQAARSCLRYLQDLAQQLSVIAPPAPAFSLDGKTPWPAMKLTQFRVDARKKTLRSQEVFDYLAMGWQIVPQTVTGGVGVVSVNFPPDLERVEKRLAWGSVKFERKEVRHPDKNALIALRFEHEFAARGNVSVTLDHDAALVNFRVVNAAGFGVLQAAYPAAQMATGYMDELAKLIVGQPHQFA